MNKRGEMCSGCPFNPKRVAPPLDLDTRRTIAERIRGGEKWVCHETCDGARIRLDSMLCAGAPTNRRSTQMALDLSPKVWFDMLMRQSAEEQFKDSLKALLDLGYDPGDISDQLERALNEIADEIGIENPYITVGHIDFRGDEDEKSGVPIKGQCFPFEALS